MIVDVVRGRLSHDDEESKDQGKDGHQACKGEAAHVPLDGEWKENQESDRYVDSGTEPHLHRSVLVHAKGDQDVAYELLDQNLVANTSTESIEEHEHL